MRTLVQAYNPAWNFVVLDVGDEQHVVPGSEWEIRRAARSIARLRITAVEKIHAIADIIPKSRVERIQPLPGDTAFFKAPSQ